MQEIAALPFAPWESFYVIVGSSAAALTGLQFVVIALAAETPDIGTRSAGTETIDAFATPTVVHFCAVLLISAALSAPWPTLAPVAWLVSALGAAGVIYEGVVTLRARHQAGYKPVFEDWLFHSILPFVTYGAILAAGAMMMRDSIDSLFGIAASALLLLFIGIHNAWDTVTYLATARAPAPKDGA